MKKWRMLVLLLTIGTLAIASPVGANARKTAASDSAYVVNVTVDGVETANVAAGAVIARGTPDKDGNCDFGGSITMSIESPESAGGYEVSLSADDSCQLTVSSMGETKVPSDLPMSGSDPADTRTPVDHRGWTYSSVLEQFGITSTEERVAMTYTRNGGSVYSGRDLYRDHYTSVFPWDVNPQAYNYSLAGPSSVFIYSRSHYQSVSPPRPAYALSARFTANPGPHHTCSLSQGSLPPFWDFRCNAYFA